MATGWFKKKEEPKVPPPSDKPATAQIHKGVSIGGLLSEDLILIDPPAADKDRLIEALVTRLCKVRKLGDPAPLLAKVLEREHGISTTLDTGLSLPHARVDGIADIATILGLIPKGLPDPKQPDLTIRAMFLFFSPNKQEAFTRHLHLLRSVSTLFQPALIEALLAVPDAAAAVRLIRSREV